MPKKLKLVKDDKDIINLLKSSLPFSNFADKELKIIIPLLIRLEYHAGETVVQEGQVGRSAYIVESGEFCFEKSDRPLKIFRKGAFFGEIAIIDQRTRVGTVRALSKGTLYEFQNDIFTSESVPDSILKKIYLGFARQVTSYIREESDLYKDIDVLLIQDGGCAPGYNPVTSFISEHLEKAGRKVFIAAEGYKSIVHNHDDDYRCLIYDKKLFSQLDYIPGVIYSPPMRSERGANFRSERYKDFMKPENQLKAAQAIIDRRVKAIVAIGGNGTFAGIHALSAHLPKDIQLFFIPVTIDSDISGTNCIGEHTGVEVGAEKIRCYMADARTHNRCYIIEMMGAQGGYHALHSCLGAGAHLAVLPSSQLDVNRVAKALKQRDYAVITVAEGYKRENRHKESYPGNAAEYFRDELQETGHKLKIRIVCEPFSRDIRGASPNNSDIMLAQRMARKLTQLINDKKSHVMPAVLANREYSIPFAEICTDNSVESELAGLANRLF